MYTVYLFNPLPSGNSVKVGSPRVDSATLSNLLSQISHHFHPFLFIFSGCFCLVLKRSNLVSFYDNGIVSNIIVPVRLEFLS